MNVTRRATAKRQFERQWRLTGKATMAVIPAISAWSLPAGYEYAAKWQRVQHSESGERLADPSPYWNASNVNFIPAGRSRHVEEMTLAGVVQAGAVEVFVWGDDIGGLEGCFGVLINGVTYKVAELDKAPAGSARWARVILERKE